VDGDQKLRPKLKLLSPSGTVLATGSSGTIVFDTPPATADPTGSGGFWCSD
jgi:hypothetical protein